MSDTPATPAPAPVGGATAPATTSQAGALFHNLLNQLGNDIFGDGKGLLTTFFTNVQKNPQPANVLAQGALLAAAAPLALPNLEAQAVAQAAAVGQALLALIPTLPTS